MYKLFIVDDEQSARNGLKDCFDWSKYDIEIVGEADDGDVALEPILTLKPDIVLTDVKNAQHGRNRIIGQIKGEVQGH